MRRVFVVQVLYARQRHDLVVILYFNDDDRLVRVVDSVPLNVHV